MRLVFEIRDNNQVLILVFCCILLHNTPGQQSFISNGQSQSWSLWTSQFWVSLQSCHHQLPAPAWQVSPGRDDHWGWYEERSHWLWCTDNIYQSTQSCVLQSWEQNHCQLCIKRGSLCINLLISLSCVGGVEWENYLVLLQLLSRHTHMDSHKQYCHILQHILFTLLSVKIRVSW